MTSRPYNEFGEWTTITRQDMEALVASIQSSDESKLAQLSPSYLSFVGNILKHFPANQADVEDLASVMNEAARDTVNPMDVNVYSLIGLSAIGLVGLLHAEYGPISPAFAERVSDVFASEVRSSLPPFEPKL